MLFRKCLILGSLKWSEWWKQKKIQPGSVCSRVIFSRRFEMTSLSSISRHTSRSYSPSLFFMLSQISMHLFCRQQRSIRNARVTRKNGYRPIGAFSLFIFTFRIFQSYFSWLSALDLLFWIYSDIYQIRLSFLLHLLMQNWHNWIKCIINTCTQKYIAIKRVTSTGNLKFWKYSLKYTIFTQVFFMKMVAKRC